MKELMHQFKNSFFIFAILTSSLLYGMESGSCVNLQKTTKDNIAISFDLDDVLTGGLAYTPPEEGEIFREYWKEKIAQSYKHYPLLKLHHLSDQALLERQIAAPIIIASGELYVAYPVIAIIEVIRSLKNNGYLIVAGTNQPYDLHIKQYRKMLIDHYGIDFNDLFSAVLTTTAKHTAGDSMIECISQEDNIYAVYDEKPHIGYFKALRYLLKRVDDTVTKIVHVDDSKKNVKGAGSVDSIVGVHLDVPGGCVLSAQPEQLDRAITNLKNELKSHGILLD